MPENCMVPRYLYIEKMIFYNLRTFDPVLNENEVLKVKKKKPKHPPNKKLKPSKAKKPNPNANSCCS